MNSAEIISSLPYSHPFLFVDEITAVDEIGVSGNYTFPADSFFYKGHFKDNPVTPGVILTECMAQIGVVSLGMFLISKKEVSATKIALTSTKIDFFLPVFPGGKVSVTSEKIYFRFGKLKCAVEMFNSAKKLVCRGEISGMISKNE